MSQCSHATIPLVCLVLCGFKWCLFVAVYHYYTYVFVTCFQEMFVVVPYNLTSTYFQQMFVFQVPGKNVKWKALLILQNKFNFILFQHLQTTAFFFSSKCTNRVPDSNMNIFTHSPSSSHRHLPEAADQWEWKTSIKDRLLTTQSFKDETETSQQECKDSYHMQTGWLLFGAYTIAHSDMLGVQCFQHFRADVPRCCSYTNWSS